MEIQEKLEFYWPQNPRSGVYTVDHVYQSIVPSRYGGPAQQVLKAEISNDYEKDVRLVSELEEAFNRGWAVPFKGNVPKKARQKLQGAAAKFSTILDPSDFLSFVVDGMKVNVGITTFSKRFVGAVNDEGHVVRKKSILNQIDRYLAEHVITNN